MNSDLGILVTGRQPRHLLHRSQVPGACGDYDGVCTMAPQDGGAQAWGKIEPTFKWMVRCTTHGRCKTDQGRLDTPHHLTCAGGGPRIHDFVVGGRNHSAQDHGAGVAPLPPPAHHKPFTYHTEPGPARTAHRPDAQRSHSRSLLVCCMRRLWPHSMAAAAGAARPKDLFNLCETLGQAVGGAGWAAAAVFRRSRGRLLLSRSIFPLSSAPHGTSGGGDG